MAKVMTKSATVSHPGEQDRPDQEAGRETSWTSFRRWPSRRPRRAARSSFRDRQGRPLEPEGADGPQPADRRADQDRGQAGRAHPRRARTSRTRSSAGRSSAEHMPRSARRPVSPAAGSAPTVPEPRVWQGVVYRPLPGRGSRVRRLFQFAGAFAPDPGPDELAWEAEPPGGTRRRRRPLRSGTARTGSSTGPWSWSPPDGAEPLEVAAQLVAPSSTRRGASPGLPLHAARRGSIACGCASGSSRCPRPSCRPPSAAGRGGPLTSGVAPAPMRFRSRPPRARAAARAP